MMMMVVGWHVLRRKAGRSGSAV
uniref:Uncharacterized protein n=1 Tax=Arundo donax TaxID=35708 RepID=A0A0A8YBH2_ARUDO